MVSFPPFTPQQLLGWRDVYVLVAVIIISSSLSFHFLVSTISHYCFSVPRCVKKCSFIAQSLRCTIFFLGQFCLSLVLPLWNRLDTSLHQDYTVLRGECLLWKHTKAVPNIRERIVSLAKTITQRLTTAVRHQSVLPFLYFSCLSYCFCPLCKPLLASNQKIPAKTSFLRL